MAELENYRYGILSLLSNGFCDDWWETSSSIEMDGEQHVSNHDH